MSGQGVRIVLATVLSAISARVFLRVGFRLLDRPFLRHEGDRFALANVGIVLPPPHDDIDREPATWERAAAYFDHCHRTGRRHGADRGSLRPSRLTDLVACLPPYSARSASTGLMRVTRRAGT